MQKGPAPANLGQRIWASESEMPSKQEGKATDVFIAPAHGVC